MTKEEQLIEEMKEEIKSSLRKALRYPDKLEMYATDMDSRSSLDRAVDYVLSLLDSQRKEHEITILAWKKTAEDFEDKYEKLHEEKHQQ